MSEIKRKVGNPRPKTYTEHLHVRVKDFTYKWLEHVGLQIGCDVSEVVRRVLDEKAVNDPSYKEPREQKIF